MSQMYYIRIGVEIDCDGHIFRRVSDECKVWENEDGNLYLPMIRYTYPDRRVKNFVVYIKNQDWEKYKCIKYEAVQSEKTNMSYSKIENWSLNLSDAKEIDDNDETFDKYNAELFYDANKVYYSEVFQPRLLLGNHVSLVGEGSDDAIEQFGVNALPVSEGQFGEYPLYAFCRNSVYAIYVSESGIFQSAKPFDMNQKIISKIKPINVGATLILVSYNNGIEQYPDKTSLSINIQSSENNILAKLSDDAFLYHYINDIEDRNEIWLVNGYTIYAYSLIYKVWFTINYDASIKRIINVNGRNYALCDDGRIYNLDSGEKLIGEIETSPIHFGEPEVVKRVKSVIAFSKNTQKVYLNKRNIYDFAYADYNVSNGIELLEADAEIRYTHRPKLPRKEIDIGFNTGYGGSYGIIYCDSVNIIKEEAYAETRDTQT